MFETLPPLQTASQMARHAAHRHRVIAENVAHADTPRYRARDVKEFSILVNEEFTAKASRPGHVGDSGAGQPALAPAVEIPLPTAPNGNSVSLEDQALRATEARGQHRLAVTLYGKSIEFLRMSIGKLGS